jgi:hypothetical protein
MVSKHCSRQILMTFEFDGQILEKIPKNQISRKFFQYEPSYSMGTGGQTNRQTDKQTHGEANIHFWQFCERA